MNRFFVLIAPALTLICAQAFSQQTTLANEKEKVSYSIGLNIGLNLHEQEVDIDLNILSKGIQDGLSGSTPALTEEEIRNVLTGLQKQIVDRQETRRKTLAEENLKAGETYLTENGKKEGIVTLASGLQYRVMTEGTGVKPKAEDTVVTHYKGTFIDGKQFDSSYDRKEPATFAVNGVIPGWTEALQLMTVGSKWQLFVPGKLAYGDKGFQNAIPPNSVLIFEIELLSIQEQKAEAPKD